jgi:protein-S-isoprenylcysteine O-methyltransferase Ste14
MDRFHFLLGVCWLLYAVLHSLMAGRGFKTIVEKLAGSYYRYYRIFYSLVAAFTLILILIYQFTNYSPFLYTPGVVHYLIATPLVIIGLVVMSICIRKYFLNLSGVDVFLKKKRNNVLEKTGLHAYVRHPLYSGTLLFIWALFILFPLLSNLIACVIITVYTVIGIKMEEEKLVMEFGDDYRSYAASVPMLIPGFKRNLDRNLD